jgi:hypothetical protein
MGTPAQITFKDANDSIRIICNDDGHPETIASRISNSYKVAWPVGRYDATEFAAAFVATNKTRAGGVYIVNKGIYVADYRYVVKPDSLGSQLLRVEAHKVSAASGRWKKMWEGYLPDMLAWANSI